jgi:hypothetical protein
MNEIFISYAHEDSQFVHSLVGELKARGIDPWFDEEDIPKASLWQPEMLLGVQRCHDFLFIISPDSIKSEYCGLELSEAIRLNKRIIPGLLKPIEEFIEFIHPCLRALNWIRFDKDILRAIRELIALINSPKGWLGQLSDRPSVILQIHYYDGTSLDFPLIQDCYWVGRRPRPSTAEAGAIALPDPNPQAPTTSRLHFELKVRDNRWFVTNKSRNGTIIFPPSPTGLLTNEAKIFAGYSWMIYRELSLPASKEETEDFKDTYVGEG